MTPIAAKARRPPPAIPSTPSRPDRGTPRIRVLCLARGEAAGESRSAR